jgi:hypothetical protein
VSHHPQQLEIWPARRTDPQTSHAAAASILPKIPELEKKVLDAVRRAVNGLTSTECAEVLGMDKWSISPRFAPLRRKGLIYDSGQRRLGRHTSRLQIVWKATKP